MDYEQARFFMIEQQIRPAGVIDQASLEALASLRREYFVPAALQALAYADIEVPLGDGQCMLTPTTVGRILQALKIHRGESVLEIGTGSGYLTALMAVSGAQVRTLEINPRLAAQARLNLDRAGIDHAVVLDADGIDGLADRGPYDLIVATGALETIPSAWLDQLKPEGRVFAIIGQAPVMHACIIQRAKTGGYQERSVFETRVPALKLAVPSHFAL